MVWSGEPRLPNAKPCHEFPFFTMGLLIFKTNRTRNVFIYIMFFYELTWQFFFFMLQFKFKTVSHIFPWPAFCWPSILALRNYLHFYLHALYGPTNWVMPDSSKVQFETISSSTPIYDAINDLFWSSWWKRFTWQSLYLPGWHDVINGRSVQ